MQLLADSRLVEKKPSTAEQAPAHVSNDGMWSFLLGVIYPVVHPHLNFTKHISWDMDILLNHSQLQCCIQNPICIYDPFFFFWINYSVAWASWIHAMLLCHIVIMIMFRFVLSLTLLYSLFSKSYLSLIIHINSGNVFMFLFAAAATARSHQQGQQRPAHLARQEFLGRKATFHISLFLVPTFLCWLADE